MTDFQYIPFSYGMFVIVHFQKIQFDRISNEIKIKKKLFLDPLAQYQCTVFVCVFAFSAFAGNCLNYRLNYCWQLNVVLHRIHLTEPVFITLWSKSCTCILLLLVDSKTSTSSAHYVENEINEVPPTKDSHGRICEGGCWIRTPIIVTNIYSPGLLDCFFVFQHLENHTPENKVYYENHRCRKLYLCAVIVIYMIPTRSIKMEKIIL